MSEIGVPGSNLACEPGFDIKGLYQDGFVEISAWMINNINQIMWDAMSHLGPNVISV